MTSWQCGADGDAVPLRGGSYVDVGGRRCAGRRTEAAETGRCASRRGAAHASRPVLVQPLPRARDSAGPPPSPSPALSTTIVALSRED